MLYVAFKLPMAVLRQAQLAGLTPSMGRIGMRGAQAGMMASRMGGGAAGAAGSGAGAASTASTAAEAAAA
jgi:hypothetical protein